MQENLNIILTAAAPILDRMVQQEAQSYRERYEREPTERHREFVRLIYSFEMLQAFARYILEADILENVRVRQGVESCLLECAVTRDGRRHWLETRQIMAGGYNIQKLHVRYIVTAPSLPVYPGREKSALQSIKQRIANMTKADKLREEIALLTQRRDTDIAEMKVKSVWDRETIIEKSWFKPFKATTWAMIVDRGADRNYPGGEAEYNAKRQKDIADILDKHARNYSEKAIADRRKYWDKEIGKLQKKLAAIGEQPQPAAT